MTYTIRTYMRDSVKNNRKTAVAVISAALLLLLIAGALLSGCRRTAVLSGGDISSDLQVYFIDVGQGDASLIVTPDGSTMLIDAGPPEAADALEIYIRDLGIDRLDYLVLTHLHSDHYGGAAVLAENLDIGTVLVSEAEPDNGPERDLYKALKQNGCDMVTVTMGDEFLLGEARAQVLYPYTIVDNGGNNDSIIIKLLYKNTTFLFTGDTEDISEKALVYIYGESLSADVLKVAHHGSSTSSTEEFISAVSPSVAVISCEKNNIYGHPHRETQAVLNEHDIKVYRTDLSGTIVIVSDGDNIYRYTGNVKKRNTVF